MATPSRFAIGNHTGMHVDSVEMPTPGVTRRARGIRFRHLDVNPVSHLRMSRVHSSFQPMGLVEQRTGRGAPVAQAPVPLLVGR